MDKFGRCHIGSEKSIVILDKSSIISSMKLYHFSIDDTEETETCNVELWKTDFFPESRDCIIPVHNILCRFVPAKYKISSNRNATEYLAINPLNRKFYIR
ncbi:hypothetical protein GLOIN_2v1786477 [Rhizophagus irregularis DAOM 181602=DAOM 197198]|nr:hypothetical protein GLOIN_2v1786477 [Rhizophagus irregularis DAOM 181602=DAOM 197198]